MGASTASAIDGSKPRPASPDNGLAGFFLRPCGVTAYGCALSVLWAEPDSGSSRAGLPPLTPKQT